MSGGMEHCGMIETKDKEKELARKRQEKAMKLLATIEKLFAILTEE